FVKLASAYDIASARVEQRDQLKAALEAMVKHEGSYLLEVKVGRENNVFPMVPQGCSVSEIRLS
ncbi:MAG: acetolactate synthase large subunit, partial [Chitinophagales bacterium]|nr:acetolactate synthase large subunit [Chitinophagales bacterium]